MKRKLFSAFFALLSVFTISSFLSVGAVNQTFEERFTAVDDKKDSKKDNTDYSGTYAFDKAHSAIGFRVKHMGLVDVHGYFRDFTGTINYDAKDVENSSVEFTAKTTSVDTGVGARDNHLRTKDFFEVEKYPELKFKSTKVEKKGKNLMITGDLTMKDVTKQVSFPFQIPGFIPAGEKSPAKMGVAAETVINRRDYNVNYGGNLPNGMPMLSDNISVVLQIEANKK